MVPGLEEGMFTGAVPLKGDEAAEERTAEEVAKARELRSPDDYYPTKLVGERLPDALRPFADMFEHLFPVKTPGDDKMSRMYSPVQTMLMAPLPKSSEEKKFKGNGPKPPREGKDWEDKPTPIEAFLATPDQLRENEYVLHPSSFDGDEELQMDKARRRTDKQTEQDGWIDTETSRQTVVATDTVT
ncbi:hypothetical protein MRB53_042227 [Persea americana]|nr:hypothetical protein MRB53_042227 [Persea americana]